MILVNFHLPVIKYYQKNIALLPEFYLVMPLANCILVQFRTNGSNNESVEMQSGCSLTNGLLLVSGLSLLTELVTETYFYGKMSPQLLDILFSFYFVRCIRILNLSVICTRRKFAPPPAKFLSKLDPRWGRQLCTRRTTSLAFFASLAAPQLVDGSAIEVKAVSYHYFTIKKC